MSARQLTRGDYNRFALWIEMDGEPLRDMRRISGGDSERKIHLLMEYAGRPGTGVSPWYTRDFDATLISAAGDRWRA